MQLSYPAEAQKFVDEVRDFVRKTLPAETKEKVLHHRRIPRDERISWQQKLVEGGYATPGWPKEFGGPGWNALQRHLYDEVTSEEGVPAIIPFGEAMIAPVLMKVGSKEQQDFYLPRIRTLEHYFCQGFSEPGAGSDLASLKCRAVLDGDEWVIDGQKMWTSQAHDANMIFMLVRTDFEAKLQEGITMLVFPLDQKGITIRPIITIDGHHHTNEVFFDNVRVPKSSLIGEVNKGWTYAKLLLGHERTTIARIGQSKRELRRLKEVAKEQKVDGTPILEQQAFRDRVAQVEIELLALELTALRLISTVGKGGGPGVEANLLKIKGSEIQQRLTELMLEAVGPYGLPFDPHKSADSNQPPIGPEIAASLGPNYLMTRVVTIYGGSNEIQRNIIAKTLGL